MVYPRAEERTVLTEFPERILPALLGFAALCLFFWNLGAVPLFDPDEGRYSDIALTMLKTGDWMIPRMNYITHLHKPPLSNWLVALSFKFLGPSEFSARLPSVFLSLLLLSGLVALAKSLFNDKTALASGWILVTSALYLATSRLVTADMPLTFFTFTAMASTAHLFFINPKSLVAFYLTAVTLACGMLTKGPVAWLIGLLPGVLFAVFYRKKISIPKIHWAMGGLLFFCLSLSWYGAVLVQQKATLGYFLKHQLWERMGKGTVGRAHPLYYYFVVLPLGMAPWSLFLIPAFAWAFRLGSEDPDREKIRFLFFWFLIPFAAFSLFRTKLATYIVPLLPPLALLLGRAWQEWKPEKTARQRLYQISVRLVCLFPSLFLLSALIFMKVRPQFIAGIPKLAIVAAVLVFSAASVFFVGILLRKKWDWLFPALSLFLVSSSILAWAALPSIEFKNIRVFSREIQRLRRPGDRVIVFDREFASLPFYLGERITSVGTQREAEFENDPLLEKYLIPEDSAIRRFMDAPERVFVLTDLTGFKKVQNFPQMSPVCILLKRGKIMLLSNRP